MGGSKGGIGGTFSPKPQVFFTNIILHRRVLFYKFTDINGNVPFKRLALLGPAAIVNHFAGSGARRQK